jgi:hypothetical protein
MNSISTYAHVILNVLTVAYSKLLIAHLAYLVWCVTFVCLFVFVRFWYKQDVEKYEREQFVMYHLKELAG